MIRKNTIHDYLINVMSVYGISIISICLFCLLFGEDAKELSSIFSLGKAGISIMTLIEFFMLSIIISGLKWLFFTDIVIKNMSITFRSALMFACVITLVVVFVVIFKWFPVNMVMPWIMFFICFLICGSVSVCFSLVKEKSDNKKIQDALNKLKEENF